LENIIYLHDIFWNKDLAVTHIRIKGKTQVMVIG